ncbi:MAG: hypothetical protein QNK36_05205 [Colwellia sp.]|nr:hypothetical protein [Colwellia sp.]
MKNKIKILAAMITASLTATVSMNSSAETVVFSGTFETIKAVTISEITPLSLVGLKLPNGSACDLQASTTHIATAAAYIGDVTMNLAGDGTNAAGADVGKMQGGGCLAAASGGVMGIYEIDGAAGASVKVTITDGLNADVGIAPSGCIGNYVAGPDLDTCLLISDVAGQVTARLAGATDTGTLGEGTPVVGQTRIALGGLITSKRVLTASQTYPVDFTIDVTY